MEIIVSGQHRATVLAANGRVDSMTASRLGEAFNQEITAGNVSLVLDLSGVDYMSSAGLRELVNALKRVKRAGGDLRIAQPSRRVREVMEMAGLDTIFVIFDNAAEAAESY